ncbi:TSUP family transporter [Actinomycetospora straminea]|uniref:Probable membrane transporter protein n=1 Tax=Actinomycetospora straminea TaxID=663607 RepID=A0ABP9ED92_9PSEU|nr:TSUP family transporter [Actinomycetospora straminea]MDD7934438.1 TSUP family transporter [Actinomycetospora straminea]
MSAAGTAALVVAPVLLGALTQRTTGLGLALVGGPFLVAVLGPRDGVSFGNALQVVLCLVVLARTRHGVDVRAATLLLVGAVVAVPLGVVVVGVLPEGPLLVVVGALALAAVLLSLVPRLGSRLRGTPGALVAGAVAGFVNVTAGVGGPAISAFALARRWSTEVLVPTAQVVLLVINLVALLSKGLPRLDGAVWGAGLAGIAVGVVLGGLVHDRLRPETARRVVILLALAGAVATLVRGLLTL